MGSINWYTGNTKGMINVYSKGNKIIMVDDSVLLDKEDNIHYMPSYNITKNLKAHLKWFLDDNYLDSPFFVKMMSKLAELINSNQYEIYSLGYSFPNSDNNVLNKMFNNYSGPINMVCGSDFTPTWNHKIEFIPLRLTFEEWVTEMANQKLNDI